MVLLSYKDFEYETISEICNFRFGYPCLLRKKSASLSALDLIQNVALAQDQISADCHEAQSAFRVKNFEKMSEKGILCYLAERSNADVIKNMNELFLASYRQNGGSLPSNQQIKGNQVRNVGIEIRNMNQLAPDRNPWKISLHFQSEKETSLETASINSPSKSKTKPPRPFIYHWWICWNMNSLRF